MPIPRFLFLPGCLSVLLSMPWCQSAHAGPGHVHGHAELGVAVDGGTLLIDLEAPLDTLAGFEHAPRTAKQHEAIAVMKARLGQAAAMWRPDPGAACKAASNEVDVHAGGDHADVTATVRFQCARPEALRHLDIELWQAFPRLKTLSVSVALPRVQFTRRLRHDDRQARRLLLTPARAR